MENHAAHSAEASLHESQYPVSNHSLQKDSCAMNECRNACMTFKQSESGAAVRTLCTMCFVQAASILECLLQSQLSSYLLLIPVLSHQ